MTVWFSRFGDILKSPRGIAFLVLTGLAILLACVPLRPGIEIPAVLHAENYVRFYAPLPARIEAVHITTGQNVQQGETLSRLSSRNLDHNIRLTRQRLRDLEAIQASSQADPGLARRRSMIGSEIELARQELEGYLKIKQQLEIKAPFDGTIKMMDPALKEGRWISTSYMLALMADDRSRVLSGYIRETDRARLANATTGRFYTEYAPFETFPVILSEVGTSGATDLFWPELSSVHGGTVPAEKDSSGRVRTLPRFTVYPVKFTLADGEQGAGPSFIARGTVHLEGEPRILANTLFKKGISLFISEGGL
jgi:putative peptide zinc metalloprotease protein